MAIDTRRKIGVVASTVLLLHCAAGGVEPWLETLDAPPAATALAMAAVLGTPPPYPPTHEMIPLPHPLLRGLLSPFPPTCFCVQLLI